MASFDFGLVETLVGSGEPPFSHSVGLSVSQQLLNSHCFQ